MQDLQSMIGIYIMMNVTFNGDRFISVTTWLPSLLANSLPLIFILFTSKHCPYNLATKYYISLQLTCSPLPFLHSSTPILL